MTLRETDHVSDHASVTPKTAVILWRGGEQLQFATESQFFRWAIDNLGQRFNHDVFWVDDHNRQVRRMTAMFERDRWCLIDTPARPLPIVDGRQSVFPVHAEVDALTTPRQRRIATLLELGLAGGGFTVKLVGRQQWEEAASDRLFWTFGYTAVDPSDVVLVCPAIIDEQTADVDDELLDTYLAGVEQKLLYESTLELAGTTEDRAKTIDRILAETSPSSYSVLQGVEAKVIDDQFREMLG